MVNNPITQMNPVPPQIPPAARAVGFRSHLRIVAIALAGVMLAAMGGWMGLAVYYTNLHGAPPRAFWAAGVVVVAFVLLAAIRPRRRGVAVFFAVFTAVMIWFFSSNPSANLDWAEDVAIIPSVTIDGDLVHVRDIRNFDYRSETDFTSAYYDKTYDLTRLRSVDYILSYWAGRAIAHAFVSFGFDDDEYLAVSIETRKEKTEGYSTVQGFFRQYELIYVVADERDLIRLRTNYRGEDVYLFRFRMPPRKLRAVFLDYLNAIESLARRPRFYNTLTENCTTSILAHFRCAAPYPPLSVDVLLSGYSARYAYEYDALDSSVSFEELEVRSRITDAAKAAGRAPDFSKRIRAGLPMPAPRPDSPESDETRRTQP